MNQKSARLSEVEHFRQQTVSFDKIPKQNRLFTDFQVDLSEVSEFFPEKNTPPEKFAEQVLENYQIDRPKLCDILKEINESFEAGQKTFENIEKLRETDCLAIVTGQQAGLFSGALYTIYKALSAVKIAENLQKHNIKTVPVFWIAEEDHDFDEISKTFNLDKAGKLVKSENTPRDYKENVPVGLVKLDETITDTIENLFSNLPHTEYTDEVKHLILKTYQPGETYSTAFAKLIARLFADFGLIIITPLDKHLKELCAPVFAAAIENSKEISTALIHRNDQLSGKNYQPQVLVEKDYFPFFLQSENGERQSLRRDAEKGKIKIQKSKKTFEINELLEIARSSPERLSPNALMRPVVQDYLLPTLAYFGGGAEIAYFAQNAVIYKILNRPVTPIRHRASFTVIERKHARTLEKYKLDFLDLFAGKEKITSHLVENFLNRGASRAFAETEEIINAQLARLDRELSIDEPTLAANLATRKRKILWHISALRKKYQQAEFEKNRITSRRVNTLYTALLPDNGLQERTLCVVTYLNLCGWNFLNWIYEAIDPNEVNHQILYL